LILAEIRLQEGESLENALRRFKKKVMSEDIIKEVKRHSFYAISIVFWLNVILVGCCTNAFGSGHCQSVGLKACTQRPEVLQAALLWYAATAGTQ
jgi:hypothetical protein